MSKKSEMYEEVNTNLRDTAIRKLFDIAKEVSSEVMDTDEPLFEFPTGMHVTLTFDEINSAYTGAGHKPPIHPALAAVRRTGAWNPWYTASVVGNSVKVSVLKKHHRVKDGWRILEEMPSIQIKLKKKSLDTNFFEFPDEASSIWRWIEARQNVFIFGPTGCGKTETFERLLKVNGRPYHRINLDGDFTRSDFAGDWMLEVKDGSPYMHFLEGVLLKSLRDDVPVILDEVDAAPAETLITLHAVLEGKGFLNTKIGERIYPKENWCVLATANTSGRGDSTNMYAGTRLMNEAFLDRFHKVLEFDYPSESIERKILITKTGVGAKTAKKIVELANICRQASKEMSISLTFSVRKTINLATALMDGDSLEMALRASLLDRAEPEDRVKIHEMINRIGFSKESDPEE